MMPLQYTLPYPAHAHLGLASDMGRDLAVSGISLEIIGTELVGMISLLMQGTADIQLPSAQKSPIGSSVLLVASSTSGKSSVFRPLKSPIEDYLAEFTKDS